MRYSHPTWPGILKPLIAVSLTLVCLLTLISCQSSKINTSIKKLKTGNTNENRKAVEELVNIGPPAVEPLITALNEGDIDVGAVVNIFGELKDNRTVEPLIHILNNAQDSRLAIDTIEVLGRIKDERAIIPLVNTLKKPEYANYSSNALIEIGEPSVKPLVSSINNSDVKLRNTAQKIIDKIGTKAVNPLVSILNDESAPKKDRITSMWMLSRINAPNKEDIIIGAFNSKDKDVRINAIMLLSGTNNSKATELLSQALKDPDKDIRINAIKSLSKTKNQKAIDSLIETLKDQDKGIRFQAVTILGKIKDPRITEHLIGMLKDEDETVWKQAVYVLSSSDSETAKLLVNYLNNKDLSIVAKNYVFFIKQGIQGSEPVLANALNKHGNKDMAIHYLNCGNDQLYNAAKSWAGHHGYRVVNVKGGSAGPRWGRK